MTDDGQKKKTFLDLYRDGRTSTEALDAALLGSELEELIENDPAFAAAFEQANKYRAARMRQRLMDALPRVVDVLVAEALEGKVTASRLILDFTRHTSGGKEVFRRPNKEGNKPAEWPVDDDERAAFDVEIEDIARDIR